MMDVVYDSADADRENHVVSELSSAHAGASQRAARAFVIPTRSTWPALRTLMK